MPGAERIRVVVADDHPLYLNALADFVRSIPELELAAEARDGTGALAAIRAESPAVAVIDLEMPGLSGEQVANAVQRDALPTRLLVLSAQISSERVYQIIGLGVAGVLSKYATPGELREAIAAVARGETVIASEFHRSIAHEIQQHLAADRPALTPREAEILALLATGASAPEMGEELHLSPTTVKTYLGRLYEKLGVHDRAAAVAEGLRRGLIE